MTEWNAAEYAHQSSLQAAMAEQVLSLLELKGSERILDVGCGQGKVSAEIAQRVAEGSLLGIDPSHDMIDFARSHFSQPNLRFEVADARQLAFQNEFDLVVSFNALHWIPEQDVALRSIRGSLVAGGRAQLRLVPVGPRQSLESVVEETRRAAPWRVYFANFEDPYLRLTPEEYAAVAERNGFRVLRLQKEDLAWDFGSRLEFMGFCAVGCVAWTDRIPATERPRFLNDVLDRYESVAADKPGEESTFKFSQMDISLVAI
ncbi:MAG: class I SAM-dependent methyltransferase [Chthoniobacterales bacterium]